MKNKKGFTIVELIVSVVLISIISVILFQLIVNIKDKYVVTDLNTQMLNKQALITEKMYTTITKNSIASIEECGVNCLDFKFTDNSTKRLNIDTIKNIFKLDDYTTELINDSSFSDISINKIAVDNIMEEKNNSFLEISFDLIHKRLDKKYNIRFIYPYDDRQTNFSNILSPIRSTWTVLEVQKGYNGQIDYKYGLLATDDSGNALSSDQILYSISSSFDVNTIGEYNIQYYIKDEPEKLSLKIKVVNMVTTNFEYKNSSYDYNVPNNGLYKIELWGAQGYSSQSKGAYTNGDISLRKNTNLYFYVGQGNLGNSNGTSFNGGTGDAGGYAGGGATDVRLVSGAWNNFDSLKSRIIVAAGSGSGAGNNAINLGAGGTLNGLAGNGTQGGTQTAAGDRQSASYANSGFGFANGGCGGGGGYYGGGGATCSSGAGGGSSFVSGYVGCNAIAENSTSTNVIHTNQPNHYSNYVFNNVIMKAGNEEMSNPDGGTMTGRAGNGYARITPIILYK